MDACGSTESSYIRAVQRKNGKIIIRAMLELEKVTFESIVEKICEDFNVSWRVLLKALRQDISIVSMFADRRS